MGGVLLELAASWPGAAASRKDGHFQRKCILILFSASSGLSQPSSSLLSLQHGGFGGHRYLRKAKTTSRLVWVKRVDWGSSKDSEAGPGSKQPPGEWGSYLLSPQPGVYPPAAVGCPGGGGLSTPIATCKAMASAPPSGSPDPMRTSPLDTLLLAHSSLRSPPPPILLLLSCSTALCQAPSPVPHRVPRTSVLSPLLPFPL